MIPLLSRTKKRAALQSQQTTIEYLVGPSRKGPKRCLHCHQPFKQGETWQRHTSPSDPQNGSYAVGIHDRCIKS